MVISDSIKVSLAVDQRKFIWQGMILGKYQYLPERVTVTPGDRIFGVTYSPPSNSSLL